MDEIAARSRPAFVAKPHGQRAPATRMSHAPPLFILGSPRSFTSVLCAMIGQHPEAYGFPELNLFLAETVDDMFLVFSGYRQIQFHGLLRTVAHLTTGEQTILSIDAARRWLLTRRDCKTSDVYKELLHRVAPLLGVDKSPAYGQRREYLDRIDATFPGARYLYLTRNPLTQGESVMQVASGVMAVLADSIDYETDPPTIDPQISWYAMQATIREFLDTIPAARKLHMRGEDILSAPEPHFARLCRWLGISQASEAIAAMMRPEDSPFARLGPFGAHLGNDMNFLKSPAFRGGTVRCPPLGGTLPWRKDGAGFREEVLEMAHDLGYD